MISVRNASYCNLKLCLIYCVVLGHWIEPLLGLSAQWLFVYKLIYSFHMPLFAFLTGLFVRSEEGCKKQGFRLLKLYCILQLIVVAITGGKQSFFTPWWHLWYLLSGATWMLIGWIWLRIRQDKIKIAVLLCMIVIGCVVGYVPYINRFLSLSRSIVLLPYFFMGVLCDPENIPKRKKWLPALAGLIGVGALVGIVGRIPASFFYHAESYGEIPYGWVYRLSSYGIGICISVSLIIFLPQKRYWFTKLGADTLPTYLIHGPVVLLLRQIRIPWYLLAIMPFLLILLINRISYLFYRLYGIRNYEAS